MRFLAIGLMFFVAELSFAVEHHALEKFLTDDVVAVAYVDLSKIDTLGLLEWAAELGLVTAEERGEAANAMLTAQGRLDEMVDFGVRYVYLLFRVSDIEQGGPTWVVPVGKSGSPKAVLGLILSGKPDKIALDRAERPSWLPEFWEVGDGALVGATTLAQLEKVKDTSSTTPRDFDEAWKALGQGDCGLLFFGDDDSRRVVREMFPPLPVPFAAIDGPLIAGLPWGGITVSLPPQLETEILIETQDSQVATKVEQAIASGIALVRGMSAATQVLADIDIGALASALAPKVERTRVRIDPENITSDMKRLTKLLSPPIRMARQKAQRRRRMNQFKNIALAFHNYADRNKSLPAQANYDDDGKPLLSWRVHLLPWLEQSQLYNQFHLDEPWDSEHNRKLIEKMPEIYADTDSALRKINASGRTTFVVPVAEGTVFDRPVGTAFREITDGTSNTILFVEVVPERAVTWTKPEDWQVDLEDPLNGVRRDGREWFIAARCDGSAHTISSEVEPWKLRAWLTRAGEEVVE